MNKARIAKLVAACTLLVIFVLALIFAEPLKDDLSRFLARVTGMGNTGLVILAVIYVPACVLFVPGSLISLTAGFAFGVVRGTIAMSLGSTAGCAAAFLVGRTLGRNWVEQKVRRNPRFTAIDRAVGDQGFKIVFLTRLSPVFPFNLLNYAFGITRVSFRDYLIASWIGMLPGTVMYVYLGSAAKSAADLVAGTSERSVAQNIVFSLGLVAAIAVTVIITRIAGNALRTAVPTEEGDAENSEDSPSGPFSPSGGEG